MQINYARKEISCKLVYYGPGMSGKTTNLEIIHEKVPEQNKGEMTSIATEGDRTLFFDFLPLDLGQVRGMTTKFQLYTVPGQVYYASTRKLVLQGADGVIFVADSSSDKIEENLESLKDLQDNLAEYGINIEQIPLVIQWNKRDLPNALPVEELEEKVNWVNAVTTEAVAAVGDGVLSTLKIAAGLILDRLNAKEPGAAPTAPARPVKAEEPKKEVYVARVNSDMISKTYFNQYCQTQYRLSSRTDDVEDFKKFDDGEKSRLLESLLNHALLLQDAKTRGVSASNEEISKQLSAFAKRFKGKEELDAYLVRRKLSMDNLTNEATKNVIIGKMIADVIPDLSDRVKITEAEVKEYYATHKERFNGKPIGEVKGELVARVKAKRKKHLLDEFFQKLREQAAIEVFKQNL